MSPIVLKRVPPGAKQRCLDIERVLHALEDLPCDKAWKISFEEQKAERSNPQNNYYHGVVLEMIAKAWGVKDDEAHEWLCGTKFGWKEKKVPKKPSNPNGIESIPKRTTTTGYDGQRSVLNKMEFDEFIEFARRFAEIKLRIFIPDPDPEYLEHRQEKAA